MLKFIEEEGGDPSKYCNGMGSTALMSACEWGNIKCVKILLKHKADINAVSATFRNALMTCAFYGKYKCAKALIKYGSKLDEVKNIFNYVSKKKMCTYALCVSISNTSRKCKFTKNENS